MKIKGKNSVWINLNDDEAMVLSGAILKAEVDAKRHKILGGVATSAIQIAKEIDAHMRRIDDARP